MLRYRQDGRKGQHMATEAQRRANAKYDKTHTKGLYLKLNLIKDKEILEKLESVPAKQKYIKELIKKDIEQSKNPL